ncbi:MAG: hypothetical protein WCR27_09690 [Eubacteriales bacterium]
MVLSWQKLSEGKGDNMFKINISDDLEFDKYNRFIDFAFTKSDAFMLVAYRESDNVELMFKQPPAEMQLSDEILQMISKSNEEAKKIKCKEIAIFKERTEPFLAKLEPFLIKKRNSPSEWPGIKVVLREHTSVEINVYRISDEVKPYLLEPRSLFNWKYPYFPDDLSFFNNGYCWFASVAHEGYACMFTNTYDDITILQELGLNFNVTECDYNMKSLFHEDYKA